MENRLVSVVVPIYNVEKYLDRCINSIVNQTYQNLEIILVDDGSPDRCPEMCDLWGKKDKRIKVIHKDNAGLGMARNTGIENARGEYICFFDSDDYVGLQTIEVTLEKAKQTGADVIVFGISDTDQNGKIMHSVVPNPPKDFYYGKEVQEILLPNMVSSTEFNVMLSACVMLFSMKMIKNRNWRFVSERAIIAEDVYSLMNLFSSVKSVCFISKALYYYCRNEESLTHTYREDRYDKIKFYYDESIKMCQENGYNENVQSRVGVTYFSFTIAAMKQIVKSKMEFKDKYRAIKNIVCDNHMHKVIVNTDVSMQSKAWKILISSMKHRWCVVSYALILAGCVKKG